VGKAEHAGALGEHEVRRNQIFERTLVQAADALRQEMATVKP
jgi:hypothetical protein